MKPHESAIGIETAAMTMRFGSFTALDAVSIKVQAGSFHALLGENGAGKSTLVKCIMGFTARPPANCWSRTGRWKSPRHATRQRWGLAWSTSISRWCRH